MDDDLENVQRYPRRYPVELWPETRLVVGRSILIIIIRGPYRVAVVLGTGKLAKIEVALSNWKDYQVKLLGEQLARMVPCGLEIRAAKFVSRRSGFQFKQQRLQWGSTRCGQGRGR